MKKYKLHIDFRFNGKSFVSVIEFIEHSKQYQSEIYSFLKEWFSEDDFIEVKTSGSTGKPKIIQLKKEYMINSALATGKFFYLPQKTTALLCMSADYIAGKMMLVRAMVLGWHIDVVEPSSSPLKELKKSYDFSAMVPLQLQNSLSDCYKVKKLIVGGGIVSQELEKQIQNISTEVFATFGMTETITHIAVCKLNKLENVTSSAVEKSYYKLLPNVIVSQDSRGCLVIDAPTVSKEQIITNDVVEIISKTEFRWIGRFDNVINSGGIKLHPEEIEKKLAKIITQRFFVAGVSDDVLIEKLIFVIEENITSSAEEKSRKEELKQIFKNFKALSKFEIPKEIYFLEKFSETETKKIQRVKTINYLFNRKLKDF